jgi:hypothetical protein
MPSRPPRDARGDLSLIAILELAGVLQFGGIFWPPVGTLWTLLNASILAGIVTCGVTVRVIRYLKRTPADPRHGQNTGHR